MLAQLQYRIPAGLEFTQEDLTRWRRQYAYGGKPDSGVRVRATNWDKNGSPRRWLREHPEAEPPHSGIVRRYANPKQTFCDFDTARHVGTIKNIFRVARCLGIKPRWIEYTRTKRGWHVVIEWNRKFKPIETVALQAVLGSDPIREMFNLTRVLSGVRGRRWNLLFKSKV